MKLVLIATLLVSMTSLAHSKRHRQHKAHSHGHAELNMAFENLKGTIEFKSPADSVVGFEHEAKSEKDKAALATVVADFESNIAGHIQFDPAVKCNISKASAGMIMEKGNSSHSDFVAKYDVVCEKDIKGTQVTVDFTAYPKLKEITTTILAQDLQLKSEIKSKKTTIELK
jgi:hypothetical protein